MVMTPGDINYRLEIPMRVFVTGASGHIAAAVIPELLGNGHEVVGLARSDASAEAVVALGAEVRRGDLDDLDGLRAAAADARHGRDHRPGWAGRYRGRPGRRRSPDGRGELHDQPGAAGRALLGRPA